jgi:hypothetical protein
MDELSSTAGGTPPLWALVDAYLRAPQGLAAVGGQPLCGGDADAEHGRRREPHHQQLKGGCDIFQLCQAHLQQAHGRTCAQAPQQLAVPPSLGPFQPRHGACAAPCPVQHRQQGQQQHECFQEHTQADSCGASRYGFLLSSDFDPWGMDQARRGPPSRRVEGQPLL